MRSRIVSVFSEAVATAKVPVLDVAARYQELGEALRPVINPAVTSKYGLEIPSFIVENVSVPPEVEQAIDKRSSMAAVGNLNDYVKFQMAQGMGKGGGGGRRRRRRSWAPAWRMGQQMAAGFWRRPTGSAAGRASFISAVAAAPDRQRARHRRFSRPDEPGGRRQGPGRRRERRPDRPGRRLAQRQENRHRLAHYQSGAGRFPEELSFAAITADHVGSHRPTKVLLPVLRRRGAVESGQEGAGLRLLRDDLARAGRTDGRRRPGHR